MSAAKLSERELSLLSPRERAEIDAAPPEMRAAYLDVALARMEAIRLWTDTSSATAEPESEA